MKESIAIAKEANTRKESSPTRSDNSILRLRNGPERQLGSLRSVIGNIRRNGGTPSVESIATELSLMPYSDRASALLALQQTHGNQYVQRVVTGIQAKLTISQQGDKYEQEADRVAEEVMRMPEPEVKRQIDEEEEEELIQTKPIAEEITPLVQRQVEEEEEEREEEEPIQMKPLSEQITPIFQSQAEEEEVLQTKEASGQTLEVTHDRESRIHSLGGGGQPLPESVRAFLEPRFGYDFSQVRVHTDSQAAESARTINSLSYTVGRDIVFGKGQFAPGTIEGIRLLSHELTHVVQQCQAPIMSNKDVNNWSSVHPPVIELRHPTAKIVMHFRGVRTSVELARIAGQLPGQRPRYARPGSRERLEAHLERIAESEAYEQIRYERERPVATLERGGSPPNFVTIRGEYNFQTMSGEIITYRARDFHVLDVIEYYVSQARTESRLLDVFSRFITPQVPQTWMADVLRPSRIVLPPDINYPEDFDPDGSASLRVFLDAVQARVQEVEDLRRSEIVQDMLRLRTMMSASPETETETEEATERRRRREYECLYARARALGGNMEHDALASHIAFGEPYEYIVTTPEGESYQYDAMDPIGTLYDVKTRHDWLNIFDLPEASLSDRGAFRTSAGLSVLRERIRTQVNIADRCGRDFRVATNNLQVVQLMRELLGDIIEPEKVEYVEFALD